MEETVIDVPVWVILSVLAASSVATLCIVVLNYKRQSRYGALTMFFRFYG